MPKKWITDKKDFPPFSYPGNENKTSRNARSKIRNLSLEKGLPFKENEDYIDFKFLVQVVKRKLVAKFALEREDQKLTPRDCEQKEDRDGTFIASEKELTVCPLTELGKEVSKKLGLKENKKKCQTFYKKCPLDDD